MCVTCTSGQRARRIMCACRTSAAGATVFARTDACWRATPITDAPTWN
jgi:hypothetical protein